MMDKFNQIFISLMVIMLLSRFIEMKLSSKNEKILINEHGAKLMNNIEHHIVYFFHFCWFVSLIVESWSKHSVETGAIAALCYALLLIAQILRIESMNTLGVYWCAKIYQCENQIVIKDRLFKYFAHPSYLAVLIEFLALPYLFHAYWTLILFFPLNVFIIINRMLLEKKITGRII